MSKKNGSVCDPSAMGLFFFFYQGMKEFCKKLASLSTQMYFYIQPLEPENIELNRKNVPELFKIYEDDINNEGIPFPIQTINCEFLT
ncbi:MAG: hypothetical protein ACTSVY_08965 [Candidatus Helarchaeota archaeon]